MSSGGRRKSGTPLNGQPRFKQLSGIYRSVEGALGQALRLSRRTAGAAAVVWQKHWDPVADDGEQYSVHLASEPLGAGWSLIGEVAARDVAA